MFGRVVFFFVTLGIVELDSIGYERGHGNESFR